MIHKTTFSLNKEDIIYLKSKGINRTQFLSQGCDFYKKNPFIVKSIKGNNIKKICINFNDDNAEFLKNFQLTNFFRTLLEMEKIGEFVYKYI